MAIKKHRDKFCGIILCSLSGIVRVKCVTCSLHSQLEFHSCRYFINGITSSGPLELDDSLTNSVWVLSFSSPPKKFDIITVNIYAAALFRDRDILVENLGSDASAGASKPQQGRQWGSTPSSIMYPSPYLSAATRPKRNMCSAGYGRPEGRPTSVAGWFLGVQMHPRSCC